MSTYVTRAGEQFGPYDDGQIEAMLINGTIGLEDMAWRDGMPDSVSLAQLFPQIRNAPPSLRPVLPKASTLKGNHSNSNKKRSFLLPVLLGVGVCAVFVGWMMLGGRPVRALNSLGLSAAMEPTRSNFEEVVGNIKLAATQGITAKEAQDSKISDQAEKGVMKKLMVEPFTDAGFSLDATLNEFAGRTLDGSYTIEQGSIAEMVLAIYREKAADLARWGFIRAETKALMDSVWEKK
jgi:hypothetical protein